VETVDSQYIGSIEVRRYALIYVSPIRE
jgi:hypothetical protein